jgi:hypothetical protein
MNLGMEEARKALERLLESNTTTEGMSVRVYGQNLIAAREENVGADGATERRDCVRLTRISTKTWALSVKRHTGRWDRTPFTGSMEDVVAAIWAYMQHLVAPW